MTETIHPAPEGFTEDQLKDAVYSPEPFTVLLFQPSHNPRFRLRHDAGFVGHGAFLPKGL